MRGMRGALGDGGVEVTGDRVGRIAADVAGRAADGDASWAGVPGFRAGAAGASFADRATRLAAAVESLRSGGRRSHGEFARYAPAVAGQFAAIGDVDASAGGAVGRVGGGDAR
ncbi:hypothetical protein [uncultured Corynebacterium sp.]|uniref:hypothetical protein n=1 Tax=uncultured Corynebacterium sp. TaxID=159447 RepID=UPI0025DC9536|nr:hypothetical protein [uncultured Corynebacterium sp.]